MTDNPQHVVAVIGGAVAGSMAAQVLAEHGARVVVFEQNARPYGKIEDGLPRWHAEQRIREYARIDERLDRPEVEFVPCCRLGSDLDFAELTEQWGFSAVILANGAWRDRPFPVEGADGHIGHGFEYQNPFIYWFNHHEEAGYEGPRLHVPDGTVVAGGGLASIDVAKACQFELYGRALRDRGIAVDLHQMETKGIRFTCEQHGIDPADLGIDGCLLIYRRSVQDMPVAQAPPDATAEQLEKTRTVRQKILNRAMEKYCFRMEELTVPVGLEVAGGEVTGVRVQRTHLEDGRAIADPETETVIETGLVISSIGSLPEAIPGIAMEWETYAMADQSLGIYQGAEGVFAVGNVVTGQGNIRSSLVHARRVAEHLEEHYLRGRAPLTSERVAALEERVREQQERVRYDGDYAAWVSRDGSLAPR